MARLNFHEGAKSAVRARGRRYGRMVVCAVLCGLTALATIGIMLLGHRPPQYQPPAPDTSREVSRYLTHYLAPNFHNNIQIDQPFEVVVDQTELNKLIADGRGLRVEWPVVLGGVKFSAPMVVLSDEQVVLMGAVDVGFSVVVTVVLAPRLDEQGRLWLTVKKVKAGAVNVTRVARGIASRVMAAEVSELKYKGWLEDLSAGLIYNRPYDPVFPVPRYKKQIRLTGARLSNGRLVLRFEPAGPIEDGRGGEPQGVSPARL